MVVAAQHETGGHKAASPFHGLFGNLSIAEYDSFLTRNKMQNHYQHQRLSPKKDSFRLLSLLPSKDRNAPLKCELREVFLSAVPEYEALSYAWAKTTADENVYPHIDISISGKLPITPNCGAALSKLRHRTRPRLLFVDAICIDQAPGELDPGAAAERNQQVRMMGAVYHKATSVLVWLGEGDKETEAVFRYLHAFAVALRIDPSNKYLGPALKWLGRAESKFLPKIETTGRPY